MDLGLGKSTLILKSSIFFMIFKINRLWSYEDTFEDWTQDGLNTLPSDSSRRLDLNSLKSLDYEKAQVYKDELENVQRKDKKNREANSSK
jgi:hypothetical protein